MKASTLFRNAVGIAGAAFVAGCSGGGSPPASGPPNALAPGARFYPHLRWAAPDLAKTPRLLFLSDSASGNINVYSMPDLTLKAQWDLASDPQGECADPTSGSVWVVDAGRGEMEQFYRLRELHIPIWEFHSTPFACAVNPRNGDVAVTTNGSSGGRIQVFHPDDIGYGRSLSVPQMHTYFFDAYDRHGNFWVDGYTKNSTSIVVACNAGRCRRVPISGGTIFHPGFVQYAPGEKTWYVADRECRGRISFCIYPVSPSGVLGKKITLVDAHGTPVCDMFEGAITTAGSRVFVGGVNDKLSGCGANGVARWNFPAGGSPTQGNDDVGASPTGAAISATAPPF